MRLIPIPLGGAYLMELELVADERGFFARTWCADEFRQLGLNAKLAQCSISSNTRRGTLRGMHYQAEPYAEAKLVRCCSGAIYDVIVDLRPSSPTYCKWSAAELSSANRKMLYVPEGFAHGFQTLEENCELLYYHTEYYSPQMEGGINALDKAVNIKWPVEIALMSDRDKLFSFIDKNSKFF